MYQNDDASDSDISVTDTLLWDSDCDQLIPSEDEDNTKIPDCEISQIMEVNNKINTKTFIQHSTFIVRNDSCESDVPEYSHSLIQYNREIMKLLSDCNNEENSILNYGKTFRKSTTDLDHDDNSDCNSNNSECDGYDGDIEVQKGLTFRIQIDHLNKQTNSLNLKSSPIKCNLDDNGQVVYEEAQEITDLANTERNKRDRDINMSNDDDQHSARRFCSSQYFLNKDI